MMVITSFAASRGASPVKVSVIILFYASVLFYYIREIHSSSWLAVIFYLLFIGGILIIFMILSSISPNEKTKRGKSKKVAFAFIMALTPIISLYNINLMELSQKIKYFINANRTVFFSISLIVVYFFFFISMIEREKSPIRTC